MKKFILIIFLVISVSGCSTVVLPSAPNTYALKKYSEKITLGVAEVEDARGSDKVGSIGGLVLKVDDKIVQFVSDYLIHSFNTELMMNVQRISAGEGEDLSLIAKEYKIDRIVHSKIIDLTLFSFDALLQPVETGVVIELTIHDGEGTELYANSFTGNYRKRVGVFSIEKSVGKLIDEAVKDAINKIVIDKDFKNALSL